MHINLDGDEQIVAHPQDGSAIHLLFPHGNQLTGYVGDTQGHSTSFQFPRAWLMGAFGINTSGMVVGWYVVGWYDVANTYHAFLRDATGSIVNIDPPGSNYAFATAINDSGVIIGVTNELGFVTTLEAPPINAPVASN